MPRYGLLGPLEVRADGVPVAIGGPRQRAILARLLVDTGRVVSTDALVDAVWADDPPATAVKTLHKYVAELRKALGADVLRTRGRGYVLEVPDEDVDALRFERLITAAREAERAGDVDRAVATIEEADRLWRGDVLADFPDVPYVAPEQARLGELRFSSLETALDLDLARGRHADVVARAAELVQLQPLRERLWSCFITALYRSGRQVEALRAYERYRRMLADELGLEPSDQLRALEAAVLRHDPELGGPAAARSGERERSGNIPIPSTRLIGRDDVVAAVSEALGLHRVVTITGPGGMGKTRLAVEIATRRAGNYPGGCWFVDLAAVGSSELVSRALADALAVGPQPGEDLLDTAVGALSFRGRALVLLDNCEHLVDECARVAEQILLQAPAVTVLATSRRRLGVGGEHVAALGPLSVDQDVPGEPLPAAVQLFSDRARDAAPGIELLPDDLDAAARICTKLDGTPLAIELAARQVRVLEPSQIAARLDDRLGFAGTSTTGPARQQTLEAMVAWSYDLLSGPARALFDRLSVFVESSTLEAAEAVAPPGVAGPSVLRLVTELVDGSLLTRERGPSSLARYRMLDTPRLYGLRQLARAGALNEARRAHARFFLDLAQSARHHLFGPGELAWQRRLRGEAQNLRLAMDWAAGHDRAMAAQFGVAMWLYWSITWTNRDGIPYLTAVLDGAGAADLAPELRAWTLTAAAALAAETGEARLSNAWANEALTWFLRSGDEVGAGHARVALGNALANEGLITKAEEALALAVEAGRITANHVLLGLALEALAMVASRRGDHEEARRRYLLDVEAWTDADSLGGVANGLLLLGQATRSVGDLDAAVELSERAMKAYASGANELGAAHALSTIADVTRARGDDARAEVTYTEAVATFRAMGDKRCLATSNSHLAAIASRRGEPERAAALLLESVRLRAHLGDRPGSAECLEGLASVALSTQRAALAVTLLAAGSVLRAGTEVAGPEEQATVEDLSSEARAVLGENAFDDAWAAGLDLELDEVVARAAPLGRRDTVA